MKLKQQLLASLALAALAPAQSFANPVEYKIPATQAEFEAQWQIVAGTEEGTWEWVDDTTPYAQTPPFASSTSDATGKTGATLVYKTPISMTAGDIYYINANVCSNDYNDDERFYIVWGTDINNLQPIAENSSLFYIYRGRDLTSPNFTYKPTDENSSSKVTVPEDGSYYIGIRSWYGSGSYADKGLLVEAIKVKKDVDYPSNASNITVTPDSNGDLAATVSWTWPTKTKNGAALTSVSGHVYRSLSSSINDDSVLVATVTDGTPGETGSCTDNDIPEVGEYYYIITTFSELGENNNVTYSNYKSAYVGPATQCQPILNNSSNPVVAKMLDENTVEITFTPRKEAVKGVLTDEDQVLLKVTRQKGNEEPVVITDNSPMESPWRDTSLTEPGVYTYTLYVTYKGKDSSSGTKLSAIFAGGAMNVPYSETFDDSTSKDAFTSLTTSSYNWEYNSGSGAMYYSCYYSSYDCGLVTPPIKMEQGKTYRVSFSSWLGSSGSKSMTVFAGNGASYDALNEIEVVEITGTSSSKQSFEAFYMPQESGIGYFCFKTNGGSPYAYFDDLLIEESVPAPAAVTDLTFTPDATGQNKATVSFTLPDKTNVGSELTSITKVIVSRVDSNGESTEVNTLAGADVTPGKAVSLEDNVPEAGLYSYTVVSTLGDGESKAAACEAAWIGYDIPVRASSPSYQLTDDGVSITWNAPTGTLTKHNGYCDPDNLKYRLYRVSTLDDTKQLVVETSELSYIDADIHNQPWGKYRYGIAYLNGDQEGDMAEAYNVIAAGKIQEWPYQPDFTDENYVDSFEGRGFVADNGINFKNKGDSYDNASTIAYLPPFHISGNDKTKYALTLNVSRSNVSYEEKLDILLCTISTGEPMSLRGEDKVSTKAEIPGEKNIQKLKTISVTATPENPAKEVIPVELSEAGRYRIAIRLASTENKGVTVHSLTMAADGSDSVSEISIAENGIALINGQLTLPENAASVAVYALDGTLLLSASSVDTLDLTNLSSGLYIVRVLTDDNTTLTAKIRK